MFCMDNLSVTITHYSYLYKRKIEIDWCTQITCPRKSILIRFRESRNKLSPNTVKCTVSNPSRMCGMFAENTHYISIKQISSKSSSTKSVCKSSEVFRNPLKIINLCTIFLSGQWLLFYGRLGGLQPSWLWRLLAQLI